MYKDMLCSNIAHIFSQNEKQQISDQLQNRKNRDKIDSPSWLGTGRPIISAGVRLALKSNS